ncbi:hypothetical protein [Ottowia thiooxydans]|uniref:hypothetical protein n=1 Tax=Ottowia thiooxydans TaxID=219182 RepID=UPI00040C8406|nr:hypothetical protein [Ottowia thiooxydans]
MTAVMALGVSGEASAATNAQGRGYGLNLSATVGTVVGLSAPLGDTGARSAPPDFHQFASLLSADVGVNAGPLDVLRVQTGNIHGKADSTLARNKVDSEGQVLGLNVSALGLALPLLPRANLLSLHADSITAEAHFTCVGGSPQAAGKTSIVGLSAGGTLGLLLTPLLPAVSQLLNVSPNTNLSVNIPLIASLTLILNEQSISGNTLTVNGLRLGLNVLGAINADVSIAHAEATMPNCAAAPGSVTIAAPSINTANQSAVPVTGQCTVGGGNVSVSSNPTGSPATNVLQTCGGAGTYSASINTSSSGSNLPDGSVTFFASQDAQSASTTVTKNTASSTPVVSVNPPPTINAANASSYGNTPLVSGRCTVGAGNVAVSMGGLPAGTPGCNSGGTWQLGAGVNVSGLPDGFVVINSIQGSGSGSAVATKDTVAPAVVITTAPPITPANADSYAFAGSCSENGTAVNTTIADGNPAHAANAAPTCLANRWSVSRNMFSFNEGNLTLTASQTDDAGNTTNPVAMRLVLKDLTPPVVSINLPAQINDDNQGNYSISGACTLGDSSVSITIGSMPQTGLCTGTSGDGSAGVWTASAINARGLASGPVQISARQTDAAGNVGNASRTATKVSAAEIDTTPPVVTVTAPVIDVDNEGIYQPSGTCEAGSSYVTVVMGAGLSGATAANAACLPNGTWTAPPTDVKALPQGPVTVTATQTDSAGNSGTGQAETVKNTPSSGGGENGEGSYPIFTVPVGGAWAGLLLLATGLGFLRRRRRIA